MHDPFEEYDRIASESTTISKMIGKQEFVFPGSVPADVGVDFVASVLKGSDPTLVAMGLMPRLMDEETLGQLLKATSLPEMSAIVAGLFTHYGLLKDKEAEPPPNRQARRASRSSPKSSKGSARSGRTSAASTK